MHRAASTRFDQRGTLPGSDAQRAGIWLERPFAEVAAEPMLVRHHVVPVARAVVDDIATRIATFDALSLAALICAPTGQIIAASRAAIALLDGGDGLTRSGERLLAHDAQDHARLRAAIVRCSTALPDEALERITIAVITAEGPPLRLDIAPLHQPGAPARCLVMVTENRLGRYAVQQIVSAFGLTRAEAEVAIDLVHGFSARDIAERRSASSDTVRKQTQAIFQKLDVSKATRLSFVLAPFLR